MRTLKDFKARFRVGGKIDVVNHRIPAATGRRTITKVQGNGYWFVQETAPTPTTSDGCSQDRTGTRCWGEFPKRASDLRIDGPDEATVLEKGTPWFTVRFPPRCGVSSGGDLPQPCELAAGHVGRHASETWSWDAEVRS